MRNRILSVFFGGVQFGNKVDTISSCQPAIDSTDLDKNSQSSLKAYSKPTLHKEKIRGFGCGTLTTTTTQTAIP